MESVATSKVQLHGPPHSWVHWAVVNVPPSPGVIPSRHMAGSATVPHPLGWHGPASTGGGHEHEHCNMPLTHVSMTPHGAPQPPTPHAWPVHDPVASPVVLSCDASFGTDESSGAESWPLAPSAGGDASPSCVDAGKLLVWPPQEMDPRRRGAEREARRMSCRSR
jgi:hypothetical protein